MSVEEALEYIKSHPEGALQSDLWKVLKIDSRKCSRIVAKLLKDNIITRAVESVDGIRTYRLFCLMANVSTLYWQWMPSSPVQVALRNAFQNIVLISANGSSP